MTKYNMNKAKVNKHFCHSHIGQIFNCGNSVHLTMKTTTPTIPHSLGLLFLIETQQAEIPTVYLRVIIHFEQERF